MIRSGRSIRQQLQYIVVSTTLVALGIALLGNAVINVLTYRKEQTGDLATLADVLGRMTSPAIIFEDRALAAENLAAVEIRKKIRAAAIYGDDGRIFASYRSRNFKASFPSTPGPSGATHDQGNVVMFTPIVRDGVVLGTLYLRADEGLVERIWQEVGVAALVGALALAFALTLVRRLDVEIERGRAELEAHVRERTAELQESNRELALTKLQADEANKAKSSFLASMSHEIRTPMNGVIGMVDVLHQTSLTGQQVEMVDLVRESAFSLLTVIDDILDFSKIEADRLEVERAPVWLADVIEKACGLMDSLAMRNEVEFLVFVDPRLPERLLGDSLRLRQVLVNLINNAIKFSGGSENTGRVWVRATLLEQTATDATFVIDVIDNGIGMDADTCSRLFKAFTQADTSTTRRFGGTGLGLVISRRLVELMGGDISVQSEAGQGSTFSVRLTLPLAAGFTPAPAAEAKLSGLRCVVVGPDEGLAKDLVTYLEYADASVERALGLDAAYEIVRAGDGGEWTWVIDGGLSPPGLASLRFLVRGLSRCKVHFVVLGRGGRREAHLTQADLVELDGNVLSRRRLLRAVALAAGLEPEDIERRLPGKARSISNAPTREVALREGRLVLVAEDNETNQKVILRQLSLLGYAADVAGDGASALERWRSGDYALLLTDLHMPQMDGYELTAAIRALEGDAKKTPIIALTANALKGEADRCRQIGMNDYMSKPLHLSDLKAALRRWLPETESASPVDIRVLEELVGEEPELVRDILADFRRSAAQASELIKIACEESDIDTVKAQAHRLKSSARTIGALRLGALCEQFEEIAHGLSSASLGEVWPGFEAEIRAVDGFLDHLPDEMAKEG